MSRLRARRGRCWITATALALLVLGSSCRNHGNEKTTPKPFTRESVHGELVARYPQISLPPDTLPAGVSAVENLVFDSSVEPPLALDVYRPKAEGSRPAVLVVHGGGWERGSRNMERPLAKRLAALGFVTVPVSYRLGVPGRFPNALFDLKNAVRWLRANAGRFGLDSRRVAALGASSGGQLVA